MSVEPTLIEQDKHYSVQNSLSGITDVLVCYILTKYIFLCVKLEYKIDRMLFTLFT